jgi:hypothetical protein
MAVTAAPAPAPCTINGRAPYLSVWNMMILSEPPRDVANGWLVGYLPSQQPLISSQPPKKKRNQKKNLLLKPRPHLAPLHINDAHKPEDIARLASLRTHLCKLRVEFGETREEEVAGGDSLECGGDEGSCLDCGERLERWERRGRAGEGGDGTGDDGEFPGDVEAVEVVGWMGFLVLLDLSQGGVIVIREYRTYRVPFFACDADYRGEFWTVCFAGGEFVENVTHRSGEYAFDLDDLKIGAKKNI